MQQAHSGALHHDQATSQSQLRPSGDHLLSLSRSDTYQLADTLTEPAPTGSGNHSFA